MIQYVCDMCGKKMGTDDERFVINVEGYSADQEERIVSRDILSEMGEDLEDPEIVEEIDEELAGDDEEPLRMNFDLCADCYEAFLGDPLGVKKRKKAGQNQYRLN